MWILSFDLLRLFSFWYILYTGVFKEDNSAIKLCIVKDSLVYCTSVCLETTSSHYPLRYDQSVIFIFIVLPSVQCSLKTHPFHKLCSSYIDGLHRLLAMPGAQTVEFSFAQNPFHPKILQQWLIQFYKCTIWRHKSLNIITSASTCIACEHIFTLATFSTTDHMTGFLCSVTFH